MKILVTLLVGILIGAGVVWVYTTKEGRSQARSTGEQIESATRSARDTIQEKLKVLDLRSDDIKDELARTGQVVRRKAREAGQGVAAATTTAPDTPAHQGKIRTHT